ncbi:ribosome-inactivating protein [Artemisia annua]|uniref:Ribosome-inactivating protein n=1 Tax=Artemisia annua TaxID=35608 RepID=A0A2U1PN50_ARTAN|nr:ribosome-inactivating protein [Artemisia annua]
MIVQIFMCRIGNRKLKSLAGAVVRWFSKIPSFGVEAQATNIFFYDNGYTPNATAYEELLRRLRSRLASGTNAHGIPMTRPRTNVPLQERFIQVELRAGDQESITVIFDTADVWVVGYIIIDRGRPTLRYLNQVPTELFLAFPRPHYNHDPLRLDGNYNHLPSRSGTPLGHGALNVAISNLYYGHAAHQPRALLVIIQMVAEAVRIRYVEQLVVQHMRQNPFPYRDFNLDFTAISLENRWSALSEEIQRSGVRGIFRRAIEIQNALNQIVRIENVQESLHQAALALMLYTCNNPRPIIRTLFPVAVGADERCDDPYGEPTTNIIGRNGLCVDVKIKDYYHDGAATMLWPCGNAKRDQLWTFKSDGTIRSNGKCLTTYGYSPGNYIMIYDCDRAEPDATKWYLSNVGTIINPRSGLAIAAETSTQGTELALAENNNSSRQAWSARNYSQPTINYISGFRGMCLQANGFNGSVWLEDCYIWTMPSSQQWALYGDSTIRLYSNRTLCVTSKGPNSWDQIILLECQGSENQRWTFMADGTILNPNARLVMDVRESDVTLQEIILRHPTGNPNQKWLAF